MKVGLIPTWLQEFEKEAGYILTWKEWLRFTIYKKLWSVIGRRPWTWIYRDIWHKLEWFPQMQWLFTGILIYHFFGWFGVGFFCIVYAYGYINGHFFWGKKYIPNQGVDDAKR